MHEFFIGIAIGIAAGAIQAIALCLSVYLFVIILKSTWKTDSKKFPFSKIMKK